MQGGLTTGDLDIRDAERQELRREAGQPLGSQPTGELVAGVAVLAANVASTANLKLYTAEPVVREDRYMPLLGRHESQLLRQGEEAANMAIGVLIRVEATAKRSPHVAELRGEHEMLGPTGTARGQRCRERAGPSAAQRATVQLGLARPTAR